MKEKYQKHVWFILFFVCMFIRVCYIVKSGIDEPGMQNDLGMLNGKCHGHLGYIYYLANGGGLIHNGAAIYYQFYHPPLHYMICAIWLKIVMSVGVPIQVAGESLQILSCIYSIATLFFVDKIVCKLGAKRTARNMVLCLVGFFPYSVFLSGALNNDGLALVLMVMTIYFLLVYYENTTMKTALGLGCCFGLAGMTKISSFVLAPGIIFLLAYQYKKNKKMRETYIDQYLAFGAVAGILGLWYPIKNYIVYNMNPFYIPNLGKESPQFLGEFSIFSRFVDFDRKQVASLGIIFDKADGMLDHNMFLSLLKYSVFAESHYYLSAQSLCRVLFWVFGILLAVVLGGAIYVFIKGIWKQEYKITIAMISASNLLSYFRFCLTHPHVCTMHVRYVLVAVFLTMICAGFLVDQSKKKVTQCVCFAGGLVYVLVSVAFVTVYFVS